MKIISGNPANVHILLLKVRFNPTDSLTWEQGLLDPLLQVSVAPFGLALASLQGLHRSNSALTIADHFMG
eukprot:5756889-Amphidinium_carterae.1